MRYWEEYYDRTDQDLIFDAMCALIGLGSAHRPGAPPRITVSPEVRVGMLPSVWGGGDAALLERMLDFYPRKPPRRILDATVNRGRFWEGSSRPVIGMDIDPRYGPDIVGDNTRMPFADCSLDVAV
jgi:hypothetical protein